MSSPSATSKPAASVAKRKAQPAKPPRKPAKVSVLVEFSADALNRADEAAQAASVSRSQFIRAAVEQRLESLSTEEFERELERACKANAAFNLEILKEFEHVDREAWGMIP